MDQIRTKVLFLCTGNSARSQMAEAILRHIAPDRFEAFSAGTEPKPVHPMTLRVLEEKGIDTSGLRSKHLREYLGRQFFGYIVVVCSHAAEFCPTVWPGVHDIVHMFFDDPAVAEGPEDVQLTKFRRVRDEIEGALRRWVSSEHALTGTHA